MQDKQNESQKPIITEAPKSSATQKPAEAAHPTNDKSEKLNAEVKKVWSKLTDEDLKLLGTQQEQFFGKVKEKYGLGKEDVQKRLNEIKASCGCSAEKAA